MLIAELHDPRCVTDGRPGRFNDKEDFIGNGYGVLISSPPVNAIIPEEVSNRGGGTTVSLEEVYAVQPDVILLSTGGPYDTLTQGEWAGLTAVQNGRYYEIPGLPYDWMSSPPSVNRVLGIWWLGNLLYPELYDYDMAQVAQEYYRLFWHYDLTEEEARQMLSRSTLK